jgi:hypothetical protein
MQNTYKIYIAGKLNGMACDYIKNIHEMVKWGTLVMRSGFSVYIPALDFLAGFIDGGFSYSDYFNNSQPWLKCSDAVFLVPGWETSEGTKREVETAQMNCIPVFDGNLRPTNIINMMIRYFEDKESVD